MRFHLLPEFVFDLNFFNHTFDDPLAGRETYEIIFKVAHLDLTHFLG